MPKQVPMGVYLVDPIDYTFIVFQEYELYQLLFQVGIRNLKNSDDCLELSTQTNQSLQYWRELNCSEQFGKLF